MNKQVVIFLTIAIVGWGCESSQPLQSSFSEVLLADFEGREFVSLPDGTPFNGGWLMDDSDTIMGVDRELHHFSKEIAITLPHRILLPNRPIWYKKKIKIGDGVLIVDADDGAQVWLGPNKVAHIFSNIFPIQNQEDSITLTIRVLNNAMEGGLRSVEFVSSHKWDAYLKEIVASDSQWVEMRKQFLFLGETKGNLNDYPILLSDPISQKDRFGNLYLRWQSERAGTATLFWGADSLKIENEKQVSSKTGIFLTAFPEPGTQVFYRINQNKSVSKTYTFIPSMQRDTTRFVVWGDSQGGWSVFQTLVRMMNKHQPAFSVGAGDLVSNGSNEFGYKMLLQSLSFGKFPHYCVPGNHDYDGYYEDLQAGSYFDYLGLPDQKNYFSWREGNCAFIALDPNDQFPVGISQTQYDWFQTQLKSDFWLQADWRFVVVHQPPLSQGWPGYHGEKSILDLLTPHFDSGEIDVVVAGHTHDYERLIRQYGDQTVAFVVTGGGGGGIEPSGLSEWPKMDTVIKQHHFGLFAATEDTLHFAAYNLDDQLIDRFFLSSNHPKKL